MNKIVYIVSFIILAIMIGTGVFALRKEQKDQKEQTACLITGCNGEICSDQEMVSACILLKKFACYKNTICERQVDGNCGWTMTEELNKCLEQSKESEILQP